MSDQLSKEELIKRIHQINCELDRGNPSNPAYIEKGEIKIHCTHLTEEQKAEIVDMIGEWDAKRINSQIDQLVRDRDKYQRQLKKLL